ncbi:CopG family transcriptional regulator [Sporosarcina sp. FSL K6-1522]|uniref:CopG family transcriptional regulator n=1 Tax=Sporosarcina sp. FSL K6-1522 TaxID=2921554 RepID=UPI00315A1497
MVDLIKLKKTELKSLLIKKLNEINDLIEWSRSNDKESGIGKLVVSSSYLENRKLSDPKEYLHRMMLKENYIFLLEELLPLVKQLNEVKNTVEKYDKGHSNQMSKIDAGTLEKSDLIQSVNRLEDEMSNLNQTGESNIQINEKGQSFQSAKDTSKPKSIMSNLNQNGRGGKREGAGRKGFGITKKVSLTLPPEIWEKIEKECESGKSQSLVLREIITGSLNKVT